MFPYASLLLSGGGLVVNFLCQAGGGAGGGALGASTGIGGSGGAGQIKQGMLALSSGAAIPITPGAGGVGHVNGNGSPGADSTIGTLVRSLGGGYGAAAVNSGGPGGNGGGGSGDTTGGAGFTGGGVGVDHNGAGGGLSAGAGAGTGGDAVGGTGGAGTASSITGSAVTYGKGGDGSAPTNAGSGGSGTDGSGGDAAGSDGKNGIIIIAYPGSAKATGGTITTPTIGGITWTVHTFTTPGTFTVL